MAIDFPNSPGVNDEYTVNGRKWVYDGAKWVLAGSGLSATNLNDLSDVTIASLTNQDVLSYDSAVLQWKNAPAAQVSTRDIQVKLIMEVT